MKKKNEYLKIKNDSNEYLLQMQMLKQLISEPVEKENIKMKGKNTNVKQGMKIEARA